MSQNSNSLRKEPLASSLACLRNFPEGKLPKVAVEMFAEWERLAGDELDGMLKSRKDTIDRLVASSANIRNAAYQIILKKWPTDSDILPQCQHAIEFDPDVEVRVRALYYFAAFYRAKADLSASRFLAQIVLSPKSLARMRDAAYLGLLRIHELELPRPLISSVKGDPTAFEGIDWSFVTRFASESQQTEARCGRSVK